MTKLTSSFTMRAAHSRGPYGHSPTPPSPSPSPLYRPKRSPSSSTSPPMANQLLQSAPARSKLAETRESKAFTLQQRGSTRRRRRWRSLLGRGRSAAARCQDQLIFLKLGFQSVMRKVRELRNCYIRNGGMVAAAAEGDRDRDNINVAWVEPYFSLPVVPPPIRDRKYIAAVADTRSVVHSSSSRSTSRVIRVFQKFCFELAGYWKQIDGKVRILL